MNDFMEEFSRHFTELKILNKSELIKKFYTFIYLSSHYYKRYFSVKSSVKPLKMNYTTKHLLKRKKFIIYKQCFIIITNLRNSTPEF